MPSPERSNQTQQQLQSLMDALQTGTMHPARVMLNELHPAEIAHLLESLPYTQRNIIWELVNPDFEGEVLIRLGEEIRNTLIKDMTTEDLVSATAGLDDIDELADFIQALPDTVINQVLNSMDAQRRERVEPVLSYPEDSAGGLMDTDVVTVRPQVILGVVIRYLRRLAELPDHTDSLIVTSRDNDYLGTLPLSVLLTSNPDSTVSDVMSRDVESIHADLEDNDVARMFEARDLVLAPVVDDDNKLIGRITIDDVVDVIRDEADHSVLSMAGLTDDEDLFAPVVPSAQRRSIWLGINLITAFMASWVVGVFEGTLEKVVTVAILMNVVASMGGIAGNQTLTLVIRALALGQVSQNNHIWLIGKEIVVGMLNGVIWAVVVAVIAVLWFGELNIGFVIAAAMIINLVVAAFSGVAIPLLLRKMNIDPAIAGNVILTTVTDIVGLFVFLGFASLFLV